MGKDITYLPVQLLVDDVTRSLDDVRRQSTSRRGDITGVRGHRSPVEIEVRISIRPIVYECHQTPPCMLERGIENVGDCRVGNLDDVITCCPVSERCCISGERCAGVRDSDDLPNRRAKVPGVRVDCAYEHTNRDEAVAEVRIRDIPWILDGHDRTSC